MRNSYISFVVLFGGLLSCACADALAVTRTSSDFAVATAAHSDLSIDQVEGLLELDFSAAIMQCECISPYDENGEQYSSWLPSSIERAVLTEGEARLLGMTFTPPDGRRNVVETIGFVSRFYNQQGRLPLNGIELLPWVLTAEGLEVINSLNPTEQYHQLYVAINPVTGKFYTGFSDAEWHPGGLYFEAVTDEEFITERYSNACAGPRNLPSVWRVVVFGENPDTVLIDKYVATNCKQRNFEWPRAVNSSVTSN